MNRWCLLVGCFLLSVCGCAKHPVKEEAKSSDTGSKRPALTTPDAVVASTKKVEPPAAKVAPTIPDRPVEEWLKSLTDADPDNRQLAFEALGKMGAKAKAAVPNLNDLVKDKQPYMRRLASETLGKIGPDAQPALANLMEATQDKNTDVRVAAVVALGQIDGKNKDVLTCLGMAMRDRTSEACRKAAEEILIRAGKCKERRHA